MRWIKESREWLRERRARLLWVGMIEAFALIAFLTVVTAYIARSLGYPSPQLCYSIAGAGVAVLLGYVVESVWMVGRVKRSAGHENWLGVVCGLGLSGLLGIAIILMVAAHREAGHGNLLDDVGAWWSITSLATLGILVTLHPFVADRWNRVA